MLLAELQRRFLGHFMSTRLVGRSLGGAVTRLDQPIGYEIRLHFVTADVSEHAAIDLHAGAEHLAAFFDHLLTLERVVDDVAVFKGQIILAQHSTHPLAPATGGFEVGYNFWFIHNSALLLYCHRCQAIPRPNRLGSAAGIGGRRLCLGLLIPNLGRLRVLVIPDKFKGTLPAGAAARALAAGWRRVRPGDDLEILPLTDGGDGFGEVMGQLLGAKRRWLVSKDAAHRPRRASWWWEPRCRTALLESAQIIGLALLPPGRFHPFELDTWGLGIALGRLHGADNCVLGIGGSATNDGGFGMARALGWQFLARSGRPINSWTELHALERAVPPPRRRLFARFRVAVDVRNPLLGPCGATRVYGPQKGIRSKDVRLAEGCLARLARVMQKQFGRDWASAPGAGAAGGLGFGLMAFAGAKLEQGFNLFSGEAKLLQRLRAADLVLTAEGAIDASTFMGKGVGQLAALCRQLNLTCILFAGQISSHSRRRRAAQRIYALSGFTSITQAKAHPAFWLAKAAEQAARDWPKAGAEQSAPA